MADLFYLVTNWFPFYTALTCLILLLLTNAANKKRIYTLLKLFLLTIITNWFVMNTFHYLGSDAVILMPLLFLGLLNPVVLYHFIFLLTKIDKEEHFYRRHYLIAGIVYVVAVSLFVLGIFNYGKTTAFTWTITLMLQVRALYSCMYCILAIKRISFYRKEVLNISSNERKASLSWLNPVLVIYVLQVMLPLIAIISGIHQDGGDYTNPYLFIIVLMVAYQNISLTHNLIAGNFETISLENYLQENMLYKKINAGIKTPKNNKDDDLKERLEIYFQQKKPYLNSELKITDLTKALATNRTYLSAFINNMYETNFCTFVNTYRLREYEQLRTDDANKKLSNNELAIQAGFSSYRAYLRTKGMLHSCQ